MTWSIWTVLHHVFSCIGSIRALWRGLRTAGFVINLVLENHCQIFIEFGLPMSRILPQPYYNRLQSYTIIHFKWMYHKWQSPEILFIYKGYNTTVYRLLFQHIFLKTNASSAITKQSPMRRWISNCQSTPTSSSSNPW